MSPHKDSERARVCARWLAMYVASLESPRLVRCAAVLMEGIKRRRRHLRESQKVKDLNLKKEDLALAVLAQHPEWTNKRIAEEVGCSRPYLQTCQKFMEARKILKAGRQKYRGKDVHRDEELGD